MTDAEKLTRLFTALGASDPQGVSEQASRGRLDPGVQPPPLL
ncbi:hypothetical protein [Streptomyces sp. NBC_00035]